MKRIVYVGSNTDAKREGIRVLAVDEATGAIETRRVLKVENAIYMALSADGARLYAAQGGQSQPTGLAAFRVKGDDLEAFDFVATHETVPCHVSLSPDGRALAFAEYSHGTAGLVDLNGDGTFDKASLKETTLTDPVGPNQPRQDRPHAHCALFTPDSARLCVVDLGTDRVNVYDRAMRALPACSFSTAPAGAGPRHLAFHPNGKFAFVVFELGNLVTGYRFGDGRFAPVQQLPLLPEGYADFSKAAAIKFSPDGRQLFCSNRGHDSLAVFDVDSGTGYLTPRGIVKLGGAYPRDFGFLPDGKTLVACLKMSGVVRTYRYDAAACSLVPLDEIDGLHRPLYFGLGAALN